MRLFATIFAVVFCLAIENGITSYLLVEVEENYGRPLSKKPIIQPEKSPLQEPVEPQDTRKLQPAVKDITIMLDVQSCCSAMGVASMCLGLCTDPGSPSARKVSTGWDNSCSIFDKIIERCFKAIAAPKKVKHPFLPQGIKLIFRT